MSKFEIQEEWYEMPTEEGRLKSLTKRIAAYAEEVPRAWEAYRNEKSKGTEQGKAERIALATVYPGDTNIGARLQTWKKHKLWPESALEEIAQAKEAVRKSTYRGIARDEAELEAVRAVLKVYPHASEALEIWKRCGVWSAESSRITEVHQEQPRRAKVSSEKPSISKTYRDKPSKAKGSASDTEAGTGETRKTKSKDKPRTTGKSPGISKDNLGANGEEILSQLRTLLAELGIEDRKWFGKATGKAPKEDKFVGLGAKLPPELVEKFKSLPGRDAHNLERAVKLYLKVLESAGE